jgi:predicted nucleotidyltransferase
MNPTKLFLRDKDKQKLLDLLDEHLPAVQAWAYGSRVNGEAHDASDLDLVLRTADLSPIPVDQLVNFLDALRESTLPIIVEARDWARLPHSFHQQILQQYVSLKDCH